MKIKYTILKIGIYLAFCLGLSNLTLSYAIDLDGLYGPLLKEGKFLCETEAYYFKNKALEAWGWKSPSERVRQAPAFYSFKNSLKFSPISHLELELGFKRVFPQRYKKTWYYQGNLTRIDTENLRYLHDYTFKLRKRKEVIELCLDILEKRGRIKGHIQFLATQCFSSALWQNREFKVGLKYLSKSQSTQSKSNLSKIKHPLLSRDQLNIEGSLGYRRGELRLRSNAEGVASTYLQAFTPHLIPRLTLKYGLNERTELQTGLSYSTPFKYKYVQKIYYTDGTSRFTIGTYKLKDNFSLPFKLCLRPKENIEISFSSDFNHINQRLDYYRKEQDDTITDYPTKKLSYFNTKPTLSLAYLYDNNRSISEDEFSSLTKNLLSQGQFLVEFQFQRDITHLEKNAENKAQNIIDPYNLFLYPLHWFVHGTEYSTFIAGNYTYFATNIFPQDYYSLKTTFIYGLLDGLNLGLNLGYRSGSTLHHFIFPWIDKISYFFRFKPYYFIDLLLDWRLTKNSLFSLKFHFVPEYKTLLDISGWPSEGKSESKYFETRFSLKVLF